MTNLGVYVLAWTIFCCCFCTAIPDIHHKMTPHQLQTIFHVDDVDLVPNYEIIKLVHHSSTQQRRKRSVSNETPNKFTNLYNSLETNLKNSNNNNNNNFNNKLKPHHVKKDLSKDSYFSSIKSINNFNENNKYNYNNNNQEIIINSDSDKNLNSNSNNLSKNINNLAANVKSDSNDDGGVSQEHSVSFDAFDQKLNLTLKPVEGLFKNGPSSLKMWSVKSDPNSTQGLNYEEIVEEETSASEHVGEVYQDESNMAAILLRRHLETGDLIMEGSIGHELVIKPIPTEVLPHSDDGRVHHVVYKRQAEEEVDHLSDYAFMEPDRLQKRFRTKRSAADLFQYSNSTEHHGTRNKRGVPNIIYPEILVIVDYDGYRLHGGDNVQVKRYFVSFWNGVDLRYRLLKGPRIRISIAGIIISRGRDATPYLERNRVGRDAIDSAAALTDMGKYLFRERRLPVYDIAVAITKLDMCRRQYANDACNRGTAGFAYVGGACVVNKRLEKVNSVAIIEDTGGFSGIIVAAHEVGHLLGAVHDGSPPPSYLGGPGAEKCRWEDGYIMSDLRHTERGFRWSPCSVQSFHHFLNGDTASCLHNAPHEDEALGRSLPGTLLSLDAQCRRDRGTSACFKDERVCAQLFCFDSASGYCVAYRPAAEGSNCGDGSHCLDGRCVAEHENIIPDYSQHTPSYASPNSFNQQINTDKVTYSGDTATTKPSTTTTTPRVTTPSTTTAVPATSTASSYYYNNPNNRNYVNNAYTKTTRNTQTEPTVAPIYNYDATSTTLSTTTSTTTTYRPPTTTHAPPSTLGRFKYNFFENFFSSRTTTTTSTTTTTTEPPAQYYNEQNIPEVENQPYDYSGGTLSETTPSTTTTTTVTQPSTNKAFQFFNNYYNRQSTTKNPYFPTSSSTIRTTTPSTTFTTTTTLPTSIPYENVPVTQPTTTKFTRHPVFDVYFKRSTTKSPYDFQNYFNFYKTSSPKYSPYGRGS